MDIKFDFLMADFTVSLLLFSPFIMIYAIYHFSFRRKWTACDCGVTVFFELENGRRGRMTVHDRDCPLCEGAGRVRRRVKEAHAIEGAPQRGFVTEAKPGHVANALQRIAVFPPRSRNPFLHGPYGRFDSTYFQTVGRYHLWGK